MSLLSKSEFNALSSARRYRDVQLDGGVVRVQSLTVDERGAVEQYVQDDDAETRNNAHLRAMLCVKGMVNEKGVRLYDDDDVTDFLTMDAAVVGQVADVVFEMAGMGKKAKEAITKNSEGGPTAATS